MDLLIDGDKRAEKTVILAHGAGAGMRTPFMAAMARGLAAGGVRVVRFEFAYMAARRKAPDREPVLLQTWRDVVAEVGGRPFIGGKSMGGRMASMVADELQVPGLICLGYPFHPPSQPQKLRTKHLETLRTPTLIVQGERDPFGPREEVEAYRLSKSIRIEWLPDGDHSFKPRKGSGSTEQQNFQRAVTAILAWLTIC